MKRDYIVERQGRSFVMYAGLLALAHERGLRSIETSLLQAPTPDNGNVAICSARVTLIADVAERCFSGIGDAAPNNVSQAMQSSLIRMAETRAKARALRDAVNIEMSVLEESGDSEYLPSQPRLPQRKVRQGSLDTPAISKNVGRSDGVFTKQSDHSQNSAITAAQTGAITSMCRSRGIEADSLNLEKYGVSSLDLLTTGQAGEVIRWLSAESRKTSPVKSGTSASQ